MQIFFIILFKMKHITIQPRTEWTKQDLLEMVEFRWVLFMLMLRDIKLRYKQTALGILWVVMQPFLTALLFTYIFGKWLHLSSDGVPYMLFAFCGLIPWLVFSQAAQRASTSLLNETQLIQKIYFPRLFLPISGTLGVVFDHIFTLISMGILMAIYLYAPSWKLLFFPIGTLIIFIFSAAFNILLSALSAHYRDFKHLLPFLLQLWMYASPLAYSISGISMKWQLVFSLNPLTGIIEFFRWCILGVGLFPWLSFSIAVGVSFLLLLVSLVVFRKFEWTLSDVI